jgi:hypothetical protein
VRPGRRRGLPGLARLEELDKLTLQRRLDEIGGVRLPRAEAG